MKLFHAVYFAVGEFCFVDCYVVMSVCHHQRETVVSVLCLLVVLADTDGPRDALRHTQSSSCCSQGWTLSVIDRRRSSVDC